MRQLENRTLISFLWPKQNEALVQQLRDQKASALAMDCIPRTLSRGQTYDALSSQANIAGYRAVLEAAHCYSSFLSGQMTAAGKVPPARVLVLGTGVAGLAAIQTAKNLGAAVSAFDVRAATAEQVAALGAQFLTVNFDEDGSAAGGYAREMSPAWHAAARAMLTQQLTHTDILITTALIPGTGQCRVCAVRFIDWMVSTHASRPPVGIGRKKTGRPAPVMVTKAMVAGMKRGSVTVDLAAEAGGNIETTIPDQLTVTDNGVTCLGYTDLPSRLPKTSSSLFANNISKFLLSAGPFTTKTPEYFYIDPADEAVRGMLVVEGGKLMYPAPLPAAPAAPPPKKGAQATVVDFRAPYVSGAQNVAIASGSMLALGAFAPDPAFSGMLTTFALSNVIGVQTVLGVTHSLHSPLMAVTNAISGTTALGGMHLFAHSTSLGVTLLGAAATTLSTVNIVGTHFVFL